MTSNPDNDNETESRGEAYLSHDINLSLHDRIGVCHDGHHFSPLVFTVYFVHTIVVTVTIAFTHK